MEICQAVCEADARNKIYGRLREITPLWRTIMRLTIPCRSELSSTITRSHYMVTLVIAWHALYWVSL